ncbi:MAG: hypothetical protein HY696_01140 [Deltaproteobacteria bacterium]|nr:hypothetical protein [Deltaproteobacteria bacterium]
MAGKIPPPSSRRGASPTRSHTTGARALVPAQQAIQRSASGHPVRVFVTMVVDDSSSIADYGNAAAVRRGHNAQIQDYPDQREAAEFLVRTLFLNRRPLFDFLPPSQAVQMDERNYLPAGMTPLYARALAVLTDVQRRVVPANDGVEACGITCLMTDGADNASHGVTAADVRPVVERMLASGHHIVAGIGVEDGSTDFRAVFRAMGILDQWIMVLPREEGDIVEGMRDFSRTSSRTVDAASFQQTSMGGFGGGGADANHARPVRTPQPAAAVTGVHRAVSFSEASGAPPRRGILDRLRGLFRGSAAASHGAVASTPHAALQRGVTYTPGQRPSLTVDLTSLLDITADATVVVRRHQERQLAVTGNGSDDLVIAVPAADALFSSTGAFTLNIRDGEVTVHNPSHWTLVLYPSSGPNADHPFATIEPQGAATIPMSIRAAQLVADDGKSQRALARLRLPDPEGRAGYMPRTNMVE